MSDLQGLVDALEEAFPDDFLTEITPTDGSVHLVQKLGVFDDGKAWQVELEIDGQGSNRSGPRYYSAYPGEPFLDQKKGGLPSVEVILEADKFFEALRVAVDEFKRANAPSPR